MSDRWIETKRKLPESGTIVEIKINRSSCSCAGTQVRECYYENEFAGIKNQSRVVKWRVSPANDLIKELEERKKIVAKDCVVCIE